MSNLNEKFRTIASDFMSAAKKRREIDDAMRKRGFIYIGRKAWLGYSGDDVVSGLLIEGSSYESYISSFILPTFDEIKFVSFSLGRRIVRCSIKKATYSEFDRAIKEYCETIFPVRSSDDLIRYIDEQKIDGFYPKWVKYLCYLKCGNFSLAREYLDETTKAELHMSALRKLAVIEPAVDKEDMHSVEQILETWRCVSRTVFGQHRFAVAECS